MQCSAGRGVFVVCNVCAYVSVLSHLFVNIMTGCRTKIKESCKNYLCISFQRKESARSRKFCDTQFKKP